MLIVNCLGKLDIREMCVFGLTGLVLSNSRRKQQLRFLLDNESGPQQRKLADDGSLETAAQAGRGNTMWELTGCIRHADSSVANAASSILKIPPEGESEELSHLVTDLLCKLSY